jgi:hypothetical protein
MRKCANCYFCITNAIFSAVQMIFFCVQEKNFERAVQTFASFFRKKILSAQYKLLLCFSGKKILRAQYKLLQPYGASFAVFFRLMLNF